MTSVEDEHPCTRNVNYQNTHLKVATLYTVSEYVLALELDTGELSWRVSSLINVETFFFFRLSFLLNYSTGPPSPSH